MNKFTVWLNNNRGMATALGLALGCRPASISHAKQGLRPIQEAWMGTIVKLSGGHLSYADLIYCNVERKILIEK